MIGAARYFPSRMFAPRYFPKTGYTLVSDVGIFIQDQSAPITSRDFREEGGLSYSLTQGTRGTGTVESYAPFGTALPAIGIPIFVRVGDANGNVTQEFAGTVNDVQVKWIGNDGARFVSLPMVSLEQCYDSLRCKTPRGYFNKTAGYIFRDFCVREGAGVPVTIGTISDGPILGARVYVHDRLTDIFTELATAAGFVWYVDHATAAIQFTLPNVATGPTLITSDVQFADTVGMSSLDYHQTRQDFRTTQIIQLALQSAPLSGNTFAGDGVTKSFTLDYPVESVSLAETTTSVRASAVGTFVGQPSPGDTISIEIVAATGVAFSFIVSAPPSTPGAANFTLTVTAVDSTGAIVTGYAGTVHFTASSPNTGGLDVLPGDSTLTSGVGIFTAKFQTGFSTGNSITASDTVDPSITGTSGTIIVNPTP